MASARSNGGMTGSTTPVGAPMLKPTFTGCNSCCTPSAREQPQAAAGKEPTMQLPCTLGNAVVGIEGKAVKEASCCTRMIGSGASGGRLALKFLTLPCNCSTAISSFRLLPSKSVSAFKQLLRMDSKRPASAVSSVARASSRADRAGTRGSAWSACRVSVLNCGARRINPSTCTCRLLRLLSSLPTASCQPERPDCDTLSILVPTCTKAFDTSSTLTSNAFMHSLLCSWAADSAEISDLCETSFSPSACCLRDNTSKVST
mmetsp:Transcript_39800/g.91793  ORF Transcript_39800/g.91793 Transcript_39800/m.91793 type:complete len:260 (-) Transcript_39800:829-1608(-)